ncbi:hypothetical protein E0W68_06475 [Flavobacterium salilacus subsp. salilacus]|uniref:hypothetical protein n=1 Tax=Flavobacterium TaxID=237 RepID=UPI001074C055|nr:MULTISPECIES: hypothetical protein [Flavobacterium]KAF2518898.1 hypothetical protein E0W68_06475 [Flavobacterium salilacus subsp. salilacus]MBE1614942.1 hypothetical protein [Flavobacterium sp. SaA2.13]
MKRYLLLLLSLTFTISQVQAQHKIDQSKNDLKQKRQAAGKTGSASSSSSSSSSSGNNDNPLLFELFMYTLGATFKYGIIGDYANEDHLSNDLTEYPYYEGTGNYYNPKFGEGYLYVFRVDVKDKFLYHNNNLYGNHLDVKIHPFRHFYLTTDYYQLHERQKAAGTSDNLSLFYFNFAYDRIRFERFNLGWTLGASYVGNDVKRGGFAYGLNAEYFLKKNISFQGSAKWSVINGEPVNAFELETRIHRKQFFITLGYEHLKIATPTYNFMTIGAGVYF